MAEVGSGKVPVRACVAAAYRFFAANWISLLPACVLVGVVGGAATLANATAPAFGLPALLANALATAVFVAAVLKRAVRGEKPAGAGVTLGVDEMRVLSVTVMMWLVIAPVVVVAILMLLNTVAGGSLERLELLLQDRQALTAAFEEASNKGQAWALFGSLFLCLGLMVWLWVRLSLATAATIGERKFTLFETWRWTSGNFGQVLLAMLLTGLPVQIAASVATAALAALLPSGSSPVVLLLAAVAQDVVAALAYIPSLALAAELYKGLRPADFKA
jgi:hypothetical protein